MASWGKCLASVSGTKACRSSSRPTDRAAAVIRCMERPSRQTRRPAASAARITLSIRATLEAKQPTATLPFSLLISSIRATRTSASDPATPSWKTLVESHTMARMPSSPMRRSFAASVGAPSIGSGSSFQSPVCRTVPSGVVMAMPFGSGMEWVRVISSMPNGPMSKRPDSGTSMIFTWSRRPLSRSFSRTRKAVKGVA